MKQGKVLGLTWESIDFNSGTIYINKQPQKHKEKGDNNYITSLKNNKGRIIEPAPYVMNLLKKKKKPKCT